MALSALLGQPANWGEKNLISKNIQGSQGVHSQIPNTWIYSNYGLKLLVQIPSTSANQSWGSQFQHKETRWNLQNLKSLLSNRQNSVAKTELGAMSPRMDSATLSITTSFYFLCPLLYSLHTSRFCNTWESSSTKSSILIYTTDNQKTFSLCTKLLVQGWLRLISPAST